MNNEIFCSYIYNYFNYLTKYVKQNDIMYSPILRKPYENILRKLKSILELDTICPKEI